MNNMRCFSCKGLVPDVEGPTHGYMLSSPGCWQVYTTLLAREYQNFKGLKDIHRMSVDTYAVQHPGVEQERRAVQSVNVHLCALYFSLEKGYPHDRVIAEMRKVLKRNREFVWLEPPDFEGSVTAADVQKDVSDDEYKTLMKRWAASVWNAWGKYHSQIKIIAEG